MLKIFYGGGKLWDEAKQEFVNVPAGVAVLEHSLVAISQWEYKYHKSFVATKEKTTGELVYYIRCMALNKNNDELLDEAVALLISSKDVYIKELKQYLDNPLSATTVKIVKGKPSNEVVTSELVYYWIVAHQIDFQVQYWPFPRLIKLVEVCNAKNQPAKKMSKSDTMRHHKAMNAARRPKKR